jgi:hypothetical protein
MGDFMSDFLTNFSFTAEGHQLRNRDHANELKTLLDLLERNL